MTGQQDPLSRVKQWIGEWTTETDTPAGKARCTRRFSAVLGGAYVEMTVLWHFGGAGAPYEERAYWGTSASGSLAFWSFTSDGGHSAGEPIDVSDVDPDAVGLVAMMPAGRARNAYWLAKGSELHWVAQAETAKGWEVMMSHQYRRSG